MEEFLTKLNIMKKNNKINNLEAKNKIQEEQIENYISKFKKIITEMEIEKMKDHKNIEKLTKNNQKLEEENKEYKYILEKVPNWIIRLFAGRKNNIGGYLYGKK